MQRDTVIICISPLESAYASGRTKILRRIKMDDKTLNPAPSEAEAPETSVPETEAPENVVPEAEIETTQTAEEAPAEETEPAAEDVEDAPVEETAPAAEAAEETPVEETEPAAEAVENIPAESQESPLNGAPAYGTFTTEPSGEAIPEAKKEPFFKMLIKKWWFWVIVAVVIISIVSGVIAGVTASNSSSSSSSSSSYTYTDPYVTMVKTAKNSNYGITYGAAFDNFFSSPKWSSFKSTDGDTVVEFTGKFSYKNSPATAKIQFLLDFSDGSMTVYHLSIDGESQSKLFTATFIKKVFESY